MTDRKKPGVAFWATVGLVVMLVGYPLSFGPACRFLLPNGRCTEFYRPCILAAMDGPRPVRNALWRWANLCGGKQYLVCVRLFDSTRPNPIIQRSAGIADHEEDFVP